jgi:hypothetical protein
LEDKSDSYIENQLESLLCRMCTAKQKQLLKSHFLNLKETFMLRVETAFNKEFNSINGLGRSTKLPFFFSTILFIV